MFEYEAMMYAYRLKAIDKQYDMHVQAWINHQVTATKEQGKKQVAVYRKFSDFFDYEKAIKEIEGSNKKEITDHQRNIAQLAKSLNEG